MSFSYEIEAIAIYNHSVYNYTHHVPQPIVYMHSCYKRKHWYIHMQLAGLHTLDLPEDHYSYI